MSAFLFLHFNHHVGEARYRALKQLYNDHILLHIRVGEARYRALKQLYNDHILLHIRVGEARYRALKLTPVQQVRLIYCRYRW